MNNAPAPESEQAGSGRVMRFCRDLQNSGSSLPQLWGDRAAQRGWKHRSVLASGSGADWGILPGQQIARARARRSDSEHQLL